MCRLPLPRGLASLDLSGLLPGGAPITAAVLGTEVQPAVVVVVTDVPGLCLEDALAAASAVLEPRLHPRTEHPAAHPVRRSVSARLPRFGLRLQTSSHVAVDPARRSKSGGNTSTEGGAARISSRKRDSCQLAAVRHVEDVVAHGVSSSSTSLRCRRSNARTRLQGCARARQRHARAGGAPGRRGSSPSSGAPSSV